MTSLFVIFSLLVFFLFTFGTFVYSANIELKDPSTTDINESGQELQVSVKLFISSSDGTSYYLRGVFYKEGNNKYCGYTYNGSDWYNGPYSTDEGWKMLPLVVVASGSAQLTLKSRFDPTDNNCKESGEYRFKVQRYTQAGSATFDDQEPLAINISLPTLTPSPSKTPSATKTPTAKPTEKIPTVIPSKHNSPSKSLAVPQTINISAGSDDQNRISTMLGKIAGDQTDILGGFIGSPSSAASSMSKKIDGTLSTGSMLPFMVSGALCMVIAVYLSVRNIKRKKSKNL